MFLNFFEVEQWEWPTIPAAEAVLSRAVRGQPVPERVPCQDHTEKPCLEEWSSQVEEFSYLHVTMLCSCYCPPFPTTLLAPPLLLCHMHSVTYLSIPLEIFDSFMVLDLFSCHARMRTHVCIHMYRYTQKPRLFIREKTCTFFKYAYQILQLWL